MHNPKKKSSEKKKQPFEKEELVEIVWCDLVNGVSRFQILKKLENDAYDGHETSKMSRTAKYNLIQEAYNNCQYELGKEKEKQRDLFYERILSVYNDSVDNRDRQNALKALDMMGKLGGLYAKEEKDVNLNGNINAQITFGLEQDGD